MMDEFFLLLNYLLDYVFSRLAALFSLMIFLDLSFDNDYILKLLFSFSSYFDRDYCDNYLEYNFLSELSFEFLDT